MKLNKLFIILIIGALVFASCDNIIGLGPGIVMDGPVVKILAPTAIGDQTSIAVSDVFNLTGTVSSDNEIGELSIKMSFSDDKGKLENVSREWRSKGTWQYRENSHVSWRTYIEDDYIDSIPENVEIDLPLWNKSGNTIAFNLPVLMHGLPPDRDFFITISSKDVTGRQDANSDYKLKVYYSNNDPDFIVKKPGLFEGRYEGGDYMYPDYPVRSDPLTGDVYEFDLWTYDPIKDPVGTYNFINRWIVKSTDFEWEIGSEIIGDFALTFEFTNRYNLANPADDSKGDVKELYYRYSWDDTNIGDPLLPKFGVFTDGTVFGGYTRIRGPITDDDIKMRNPDTGDLTGRPLPKKPGKMYTPIQVVSYLRDGAGNSALKSNGWFAWLPEADKPWAHVDFGTKYAHDDDNIPDTAPDILYMATNSKNESNFAYDNEGVAHIDWKLYKLVDGTLDYVAAEPGTDPDGSRNKPWTGHISAPAGNPTRRLQWTFTADGEFGIGRYKIEITVTDITGVQSDPLLAFFAIESNNTPSVREITVPPTSETLWGDNNGNFKFSGVAEIEDTTSDIGINTVKVDRVTITWIKPDPNPQIFAARRLKYSDRNYENWNKAPVTGYFEDTESRVWEVPAANIIFRNATDGNKNINDQEEYEFSLDMNLFTDFNIWADKNSHSAQTFLVRVLSRSSEARSLSRVRSHTSVGDNTAPRLDVEKITITGGTTQQTYTKSNGSFGMILKIEKSNKLQLEGTWSDFSFDHWTGVSPVDRLRFFRDFKINWGTDIELQGEFKTDGTWISEIYTFEEDNKSAIVDLSVHLTDLNSNQGETRIPLVVETEVPVLTRISSELGDGAYGLNKNTHYDGARFIEIFLDFNNPVKFFDNIGSRPYFPPAGKTAPQLVLNNHGRAFYYSGNGENRLIFRYYIDDTAVAIAGLPTYVPGKGGTETNIIDQYHPEKNKLNVLEIDYGDFDPDCIITIIESETPAIIDDGSVFGDGSNAFIQSKNITIDKTHPLISGISTMASEARPHGVGSSIYITLTFDERVVVSGASASNFYLTLGGLNPGSPSNRASFANVSGPQSVSFLYTVQQGDNGGLNVASINTGAGLSIKDMAGNELQSLAVPSGGNLGRTLVIDTTPPSAPGISGTSGNHYQNSSFTITAVEANATVEYHLDCPNPAAPPSEGWVAVSNASASIPLERNGTFNIVARQHDNATPANVSPVSSAPLKINIDKNPLITRISSSTPDGDYGFNGTTGNTINIDVYFRIPLSLNTSAGSPYLLLNVQGAGANNNRALLQAGQTGTKQMWTFVYTIPNDAANAARLDLSNYNAPANSPSFDMNGAVFSDSTSVNVTQRIDLSQVIDTNRLNSQKNIQIISGYPAAANSNFGTTAASAAAVVYFNNQLRITFNRDISRGDTANQLVIKQIATGYRIPAVMSETKWNAIFINRTDIWDAVGSWAAVNVPAAWGANNQAKADFWHSLGEYLYPKGSNGATVTGSDLVSDTSVKRVLRFGIDTAAADSSTADLPANVTMGNIKNAMRSAEALRFNARDSEVSIAAAAATNPAATANRTLIISLSGEKALPVSGTSYQWFFPNGFVKDALEKPNGNSLTGSDDSLTSGNPETAGNDTAARRLPLTGNETPVIRIDKGSDAETFTGTGDDRQAVQPLTTRVRIDGRTPSTTFQYRTRQTTDNVGRLIFRNGQTLTGNYQDDTGTQGNAFTFNNGIIPATTNNSRNGIQHWGLPNLGNQHPTDQASYNLAKNRPQSGNATTNHPAPGLNYWTPIPASLTTGWTSYTTYTPASSAPFNIGVDNYNAGGMIIQIHARLVQDNSIQAYEAAYRSVFVFNNAAINNNGALESATSDNQTKLLNLGFGWSSQTSILPNYQRGRMWIRGGDTIGGDSSVPDFPIARDRALARKARLMTPIDVSLLSGGQSYDSNANATAAEITNTQIPETYRQETPSAGTNENRNYPGAYLWFWVTWKVNVNAYIDHFCGELPASTTAPQVPMNYKELYKGIMPSKEHYPVIPGRTTVFETRRVYRVRYGGQGGQLDFGSLISNSPEPTDLTSDELTQWRVQSALLP